MTWEDVPFGCKKPMLSAYILDNNGIYAYTMRVISKIKGNFND